MDIISISMEGRLASTWSAVVDETSRRFWTSDQVGMTLMVRGNVPSTRSLENATIYMSVLEELVNDTEIHSIPQSTRTWCGGPATTTTRARRSLRDSGAIFSRRSFTLGVVLVFIILKILG